jgi:hypothetical protein
MEQVMKPRYDFNKGKLISYDGQIIEFAGSAVVDKYPDQVQEIMDLFDLKKGEYLITDESSIGDFGKETINKVLLENFKKKYKFSLTNKTNISKIAERMYNFRPF